MWVSVSLWRENERKRETETETERKREREETKVICQGRCQNCCVNPFRTGYISTKQDIEVNRQFN